MKKIIIAICGESCTGKTTLINAFKSNNDNWFIPQHFTTRKPRNDDDSFYEYVNEKSIKYNDQIWLCSGEGGHMYGMYDFDCENSIINPSLKDIPALIKKCNDKDIKLLIIVLYSSNIDSSLKNMNRFSESEFSYRRLTNMNDFQNLLNFKYSNYGGNNKVCFLFFDVVLGNPDEKVKIITTVVNHLKDGEYV